MSERHEKSSAHPASELRHGQRSTYSDLGACDKKMSEVSNGSMGTEERTVLVLVSTSQQSSESETLQQSNESKKVVQLYKITEVNRTQNLEQKAKTRTVKR